MPCYDPRGHEIIREIQVSDPKDQERILDLQEMLDRATRHLCYMVGKAKEADVFDLLPEDIREWANNHHDSDEKRVIKKIAALAQRHNSAFVIAQIMIEAAEKEHSVSNWHKDWFYELAKEALQDKSKHDEY